LSPSEKKKRVLPDDDLSILQSVLASDCSSHCCSSLPLNVLKEAKQSFLIKSRHERLCWLLEFFRSNPDPLASPYPVRLHVQGYATCFSCFKLVYGIDRRRFKQAMGFYLAKSDVPKHGNSISRVFVFLI